MAHDLETLRRQLGAAGDLNSVVRAMKALAASSLVQYERSAVSLRDYFHTLELGLIACLSGSFAAGLAPEDAAAPSVAGIVLFGSDQGLVGQFNENIVEYLQATLRVSQEVKIWAVGERVADAAADKGFHDVETFAIPASIQAVGALISRLLVGIEGFQRRTPRPLRLEVVHQRPAAGTVCEPRSLRILPIDGEWRRSLEVTDWPTYLLPEVVGPRAEVLAETLREYTFVALFRACVESLASENASRLAGMQRAEKNIEQLSADLTQALHRSRQAIIDEELFDVIMGHASVNAGVS